MLAEKRKRSAGGPAAMGLGLGLVWGFPPLLGSGQLVGLSWGSAVQPVRGRALGGIMCWIIAYSQRLAFRLCQNRLCRALTTP